MKPNDLSKQLKNITGYSDADWAGDPVTRKNTSCTLCYADQFLLSSDCKGQGTVALSRGESELYALGAESAELIFAQEVGLSFLTHTGADSNTARVVAEKRRASRKMKHTHTRSLCIQDLVFWKLLTRSAIKKDVNRSDIKTKALGRQGFSRLRASMGLGNGFTATHLPGNWDDDTLPQNFCAELIPAKKNCSCITE